MLMLIKRNFLLYFRNHSGVILSLFGAIIPFVLYLVFLKNNMKGSWSDSSHATDLLDFWLISGTLAVTALTTTLSAFSQQTEDRERKVTADLFITDLGQWGLRFSYLISAFVIGFVMQVFMFAVMLTYFILADKISFDWGLLPQLACLMLLNSLLASLLNALVVPYFKSVNSLGQYATVIGAASGFLVGTYIPIGTLPSLAQNLMKLTPSTYMASLFRQVLMKESLTEVFADQSQLQQEFEKLLGIRIEWQKLLTSQETYYIVVVVLVTLLVIWSSAHGSSPLLARSKLAAESTDELQVKKVGGLGLQTRFEEDAQISSQDPLVVVRADQLAGEAKVVLDYLENFKAGPSGVLPIKSDDKLVMLKTEDIILADINQTTLMIYSTEGVYTTTETLTRFQNRLNSRNFIQVSRHAVINIDHLESLSDSFSGNMTAKLTNQLKTDVSRRYVKLLMDYLGI